MRFGDPGDRAGGAGRRGRKGAAPGSRRRWWLVPCAAISFGLLGAAEAGGSLLLTPAERQWIAAHPVVRIAYDGYFPPYSTQREDGGFEGLAVEVMELLAEKAGIRLEVHPQGVWKDLYAAAQRREVDLVATMVQRPDRAEWFLFTRPYIRKSLVIMSRAGDPGIASREDVAGRRIALVRGYQYVPRILDEFPTVVPVLVDTMLEGLNAVATGEADGAVTFLGAGYYLKARYQLADLRFAAVYDRESSFESIAVRRDWPELAAILDKALLAVAEPTMLALHARWQSDEELIKSLAPRPLLGRRALIALVALLALAVAAAAASLLWNRTLRSRVKARTAELRGELTERARVEAALRESEAYNRLLFEASPIGLALCRMDGRFVDVNPAHARIIGRSVEETLGLTYWDITPESHAGKEREQLESLARTGRYGPYEKEYRHRDGRLVPVRLQGLLVQRGGEDFIWSSVEDVTERRQLEEERQRRHEELERTVGERTGELRERNADLERTHRALQYLLEDVNESNARLAENNARLQEIDRLKSLFIASMSHELRTPLNSIIGFTGVLLMGLAGPLAPEQRRQLGMVKDSADHLLALINDIIDLGRIEAGRIELASQPFDLAATVRDAAESLRVAAEAKRVDLTVDAPGTLPVVGDPRRARQVLVNLVGNAVKFTERGRVAVTAAPGDGVVAVEVRDTGPGIAPSDLDRLFRPFEQLGAGRLPRHEGAGLGLYLSKRLIELLGGRITAESRPGEGSVFRATFPAEEAGVTG